MPVLSQSSISLNSDLHVLLTWAGRFSADERCQQMLIKRTIAMIGDNPDLIEDGPLEYALFRVMRRLVIEDLAPPRGQIPAERLDRVL
ncbi:hypothetical protein [Rhizobium terrae]|uniref:hypothetical protein n=1 Tax=Rhizobium terrae TaxID=2171756 RepID=UPI000E3D3B00|nr:hypothetical protein [Rhizobium terrae]